MKPTSPENTASSIDLTIGQRLRARRENQSLSQKHVADQLGISFQQLQKYENATNRISASRLFNVADILQVPINYFFDDLPYDMPSFDDSLSRRRWNRIYDHLSLDVRSDLLKIIDRLTENE